MKFLIFSFKYMIGIIAIWLFVGYFYSYKIKEDNLFIQNEINKILPKQIEKKGVNITINKLDLIPFEGKLKANFDLNINSKIYNVQNRTGYVILKEKYQNGKIIFNIFDINFDNLTFEEVFEETKEPINEIKNEIKNKIDGFLSKNLGTTEKTNDMIVKDVSNKLKDKFFNKETLKIIIFENIKQTDIKVYDLGFYGLFVKDIKLNILDNDFSLEITLSTGLFGLIFGSMLIFLSLGREIFLFFIYIYQKFISKHKGYNCARGVVSEDYTCSSYVKKEFKEKGLIAGLNAWSSTSKKCKEDFETYKDNQDYYDNKRKSKNNSSYCDGLDVCQCLPSGNKTNACDGADACDVMSCGN